MPRERERHTQTAHQMLPLNLAVAGTIGLGSRSLVLTLLLTAFMVAICEPAALLSALRSHGVST